MVFSGVSTVDILQGYANAVECLRRLDPTCVIMQKICSIIRTYIKFDFNYNK